MFKILLAVLVVVGHAVRALRNRDCQFRILTHLQAILAEVYSPEVAETVSGYIRRYHLTRARVEEAEAALEAAAKDDPEYKSEPGRKTYGEKSSVALLRLNEAWQAHWAGTAEDREKVMEALGRCVPPDVLEAVAKILPNLPTVMDYVTGETKKS